MTLNRGTRDSLELQIPYRSIERMSGRDSADEAGDEIVECIRQLEDHPHQFSYAFDQDLTHTNPWYHCLIVRVCGIPYDRREIWYDVFGNWGLSATVEAATLAKSEFNS